MSERYDIYKLSTDILLHSVIGVKSNEKTDKENYNRPYFELDIKKLAEYVNIEKRRMQSGKPEREQRKIESNNFISIKSADNMAFNQIYEHYKSLPGQQEIKKSDIIEKNIVLVKFSEYASKDPLEDEIITNALNKYDEKQNNKDNYLESQHDDKSVGRYIFENGFSIKFAGDENQEKIVEFVRFEKSQSMARNCVITFINSAIKDEIEKRITLDLEGQIEKATISKWHAYKGLSLTNAQSVNLDLNEKKVIVVADNIIDGNANIYPWKKTITAEELKNHENTETENKKAYKLIYEKTLKDYKIEDERKKVMKEASSINQFDGAGLISSGYAKIIEWQLTKQLLDNSPITSFQFRMPFCKGMLHKVDFKKFFREELNLEKIKDVWGKEHEVNDVEIILTESQYKVKKWFEIKGRDTAWSEYWKKFQGYNHKLYIVQYNKTNKEQMENERLNYQVLHTLDIDENNFSKLLDDSISAFNKLKSEYKAQIIHFLNFKDNDEIQPDDDIIEIDEQDEKKGIIGKDFVLYTEAISQNARFIREIKIKSTLANNVAVLKNDFRLGHFIARGKNRFLSPDLLKFLYHIAKRSGYEFTKEEATQMNKKYVKNGCFYAPGFKATENSDANKKYSIIRNPHISRNEHVVAQMEKPDILLEKYFGHLEGVCMINPLDCFAERLAGADYDGDMVKIIDNEIFVEAIPKGLPIIKIPKIENENKEITLQNEWTTTENTFNSSVGVYCNYAFAMASEAYGKNNSEIEKDLNLMTILIGLEIDSAKTGVKPFIPKKFKYKKEPFLELKDRLKKGDAEQPPEKDSISGHLNVLDRQIFERTKNKSGKKNSVDLIELIEIDIEELKTELPDYNEKKLKMAALLFAYNSNMKEKDEDEKNEIYFNSSKYGKLLKRILEKQGYYTSLINDIENRFVEIYNTVSLDDIDDLLHELNEINWAFTENADRKNVLEKILNKLNDETKRIINDRLSRADEDGNETLTDIFCDFNFNGYNSISLFFKHIRYLLFGNMEKIEWFESRLKQLVVKSMEKLGYNIDNSNSIIIKLKNILRIFEENKLDELNKFLNDSDNTASENTDTDTDTDAETEISSVIGDWFDHINNQDLCDIIINDLNILENGWLYEKTRRKNEYIIQITEKLLGETGKKYKIEYENRLKNLKNNTIDDRKEECAKIALEICENNKKATVGICVDICGDQNFTGNNKFRPNQNNKIFWICAAGIAINDRMIKNFNYKYPEADNYGDYEYLYQKYITENIDDFEPTN